MGRINTTTFILITNRTNVHHLIKKIFILNWEKSVYKIIFSDNFMNFVENFNNLTIGEYFVSGILYVILGIYSIFATEPRVFNEIPLVYFLLIFMEISVFLIPFFLAYLIYYQKKYNKEFFEYDQIGSYYKLFRIIDQEIFLFVSFILIILLHLIIRFTLNEFLSSSYSHDGFPVFYGPHIFLLVSLLIAYLIPYLLLLLYNNVITNRQGKINKINLGFTVNAIFVFINIIIFVFLFIYSALFMTLTHFFYFYLLD